MGSSQSKSGNKKAGRNLRKPSCQRYTNSMRWLENKKKKLRRHIRKVTDNTGVCNDLVAIKALKARS